MFTLQTSFKPLLLKGGRGVNSISMEVTVNSKEKTLKTFVPVTLKNSASGKLEKVAQTCFYQENNAQ
jgi:hypothetical protein